MANPRVAALFPLLAATALACGDTKDLPATTIEQETFDIPSQARPADTPGSPGVPVTNPKLLAQFGGSDFTLNRARYTRWRLEGAGRPDAILVLIPGFEGGAANFAILAENVILRARDEGQIVELWGFDRRSNQLEDLAGADIAEEELDAQIALDWFFGGELSLTLHPLLAAGPNRRAQFYDPQSDIPFLASWTNLVFSQDIDAVIEEARTKAKNQNVFLGGHSAGTGFTARYAATDLNLSGNGAPEPGYAKVRGLVLLEGAGGSTAGAPLSEDALDRIEAKFDGGLFGAVRDNAPRCVDGVTACTIATEASDCAGQSPAKCTLPTTAYSIVAGILNPRILATSEIVTIQAATDPDSGRSMPNVPQGAPDNTAVNKVPDLASLGALAPSTALGGLGGFIDDDGPLAALAAFLATSVGAPGPVVDGLVTWQDITEGPLPASVLPNNGPPPTSLPAGVWGQEKESTLFDRLARAFYRGQTNFVDLYYPASGLGVTAVSGQCSEGVCVAGNVGAGCESDGQCSQSVGLDSTALSIGRGRRDIENLTQAAGINVPVIAVAGTNGLATVPAYGSPSLAASAPAPLRAASAPRASSMTRRRARPSRPTATLPAASRSWSARATRISTCSPPRTTRRTRSCALSSNSSRETPRRGSARIRPGLASAVSAKLRGAPPMAPRTVHFVSLGCAKNRVDTEVMLGVSDASGFQVVEDPSAAEVIVVNTCGFIGPAKQESIDTILEMARYKESGSCERLVVAGCLAQRYVGQLADEMPEVDHFLGSSDMLRLGEVLDARGERLMVGNPADWVIRATDPRRLTQRAHSAYVKIAEGCNRTCSFCAIPSIRGLQRSRPIADVVREVEWLVAQGVVEANLVSQDTVAYGRDLPERASLAGLVRAVADVPGIRWVRLHYLYPETLPAELLELFAGHPNVLPYIDMPLQHVSDTMLRRMRRGHGGQRVRDVVERLRTAIPEMVFRTTLIVGHPGESDADFEELQDFVRWAEFDHVGVFLYSHEEDTRSGEMDDLVPAGVARTRQRKLMALQRQISRRKMKARIGSELEVLVDGPSEESELLLQGRFWGQAPEVDGRVVLTNGWARAGELRRARVTKAADYDLVADLLESDDVRDESVDHRAPA